MPDVPPAGGTTAATAAAVAHAPPRAPGQQRRRFLAAWAFTAAALLLVVVWTRSLSTPYLLLPAFPLLAALVLFSRLRGTGGGGSARVARLPLYAAMAAALVALGVAGAATYQLSLLGSGWDALVAQREQRLTRKLDARMRILVQGGRDAVNAAAAAAAAPSRAGLFVDLAALQQQTGVSAIAVIDSTGQLVAWAGNQRGRLPDEVRGAGPPIQYRESPLFSYLYFTRPVGVRGEHAVAAVLLQTRLPVRDAPSTALADRFEDEQRARLSFALGGGVHAAWTLRSEGRPVVHASFERLTQAAWRDGVATRGRRGALLAVAAGLLLLAWSWLRRREGRRGALSGVPLALLALAAALAPLGDVLGIPRLFSPGLFMLPFLPLVVSLGALMAVLLPVGALVASMRVRPPGARGRWWALGGAVPAVGLGYAGGLYLVLTAANPQLLQGGIALWGGLQVVAVLLLTIVAASAFPFLARRRGREQRGHERVRIGLVLAGGALAAALALLVIGRWESTRALTFWSAVLWGLPFALMALGLAAAGEPPRLARWSAGAWLAATAVLPFVWVAHVEARLGEAERQVGTLGTRADPYLDFLLRQNFAPEVRQRYGNGERGVELLYRTWVASGFAQEAYPARIMLWNATADSTLQLNLGGAPAPSADSVPHFLLALVDRARRSGGTILEPVRDVREANQAMAVPLDGEHVVTVVVPPRKELTPASGLAPFLGRPDARDIRLELVPARHGLPLPPDHLAWQRNDEGWRGEILVQYPDMDYHAHVQVVIPSLLVRLARATLLTALDLAIVILLWALGNLARGEVLAPHGGWLRVLRGFRARLTAALFLFFLIPTAVFGLVAYRALAGEVVRSARVVAENAVGQGVSEFNSGDWDLRALAMHTGQDLQYYLGGELAGASNGDALSLGVYDAWMPPDVYLALQSGEELSATETQLVVDRPYVVAYQRLPVTATLAVPVPLAAGESAARQQELAHIILFAVLMGGLLTLGLSLMVGRALATPIGRLSHAAALVGGGRLRVQLPEDRHDEFGALFASFNHMTRRLRRARAQQLRSARVLAWGEMARQVAHEIKNPLTPIKLAVQHIRRAHADARPDFPQILQANVDQVLAEIDRLSEIARAFSRYGAPSGAAGPLEGVDVGAVVHDALTLYRAGDAVARYVETIQAPLPRGRARAGELKEVVLNLVENARAAFDGRTGTITVQARALEAFVEVVVRDDGPGIPPDQLPRIFEPHFSTRSTGTGLGLAIVRRLVESWGGEVTAESEPGLGTAVRVRIPVADAPTPGA